MKISKRFALFLIRWKIIIICFLFALSLYVAFYFSGRAERHIAMPLQLILPEGFEVGSLMPEDAEVVIKGRETQIYMIDVDKIHLYADFSKVERKGVAAVPVVIDYEDMLDYVNLADLSIFTSPAMVKIYFE